MKGASPVARPAHFGTRSRLGLALLAAGACAYFALGVSFADFWPNPGGRRLFGEFFGAALRPALDYQASSVPSGAPPFLLRALDAARATLVFAAAGMSLALVLGLVLGFLASSAWWTSGGAGRSRSRIGPLIYGTTRVLIVGLRSTHELLWAVLFMAAFGLTPFAGVVAIALPYGGTLAKVFAEMLEEAPRAGADHLRVVGARPAHAFLGGLLPHALPNMSAYAFYRFECAVRSSAVLGFFGYPTLGLYLMQSFDNVHYHEVWTYLYVLIALVVGLDLWSARLRRRFVA